MIKNKYKYEEESVVQRIKKQILKSEKIVSLVEKIARVAFAFGIILSAAGGINMAESVDNGMPMVLAGAAALAAGTAAFAVGYPVERKISKMKEDCQEYEDSLNTKPVNFINR